jgi:excisionase family DNA binding protein
MIRGRIDGHDLPGLTDPAVKGTGHRQRSRAGGTVRGIDRGRPETTISDLIRSGKDFTDVPVTAGILQCDRRTVRRRIADGTIPAVRIGTEWRIPVRWLAEAAGAGAAA